MSKKNQATKVVSAVVPEVPKTQEIPLSLESLQARIQVLEDKIAAMAAIGRGRGPISTRGMNKDDAIKIMTGDMKDRSIKDCAKDLGLSYGQVYSARNGYTFKEQYAERKALEVTAKTK
jgi:hypothetical protein